MTERRVIVGFDPSSTGRNALWWSVKYANTLDAILYVVSGTRTPRLALSRPGWSTADDGSEDARVELADALLLAVGEPPPDLDIRVASVAGSARVRVPQLADRASDVVVLAGTPRSWRSPAVLFVVHDPLSPPTINPSIRNAQRTAQVSRFLLR